MQSATLKTRRERDHDPFDVKCKTFLEIFTKCEGDDSLHLSAYLMSPSSSPRSGSVSVSPGRDTSRRKRDKEEKIGRTYFFGDEITSH